MSRVISTEEDFDQVMKEAREHGAELARMVYVEDGHIVINVHSEYNIALGRCDTHEKILAWVIHLSEKTWMTLPIIDRFIRLAMSENKLEVSLP